MEMCFLGRKPRLLLPSGLAKMSQKRKRNPQTKNDPLFFGHPFISHDQPPSVYRPDATRFRDFEISATGRMGRAPNPPGGAFFGVDPACSLGDFSRNWGPELDVLGGPAWAQVSGATCPPVSRFRAGRRSCDFAVEFRKFGFRDFGDRSYWRGLRLRCDSFFGVGVVFRPLVYHS